MNNAKLQKEIYCGECGSLKKSKYCDVCQCETSDLFKMGLSAVTTSKPWMKEHMKSEETVRNKPKREVEQWNSKKDENVITRYERLRNECKPTKVFHTLWRKFGDIWEKVHEDKK